MRGKAGVGSNVVDESQTTSRNFLRQMKELDTTFPSWQSLRMGD